MNAVFVSFLILCFFLVYDRMKALTRRLERTTTEVSKLCVVAGLQGTDQGEESSPEVQEVIRVVEAKNGVAGQVPAVATPLTA